MKTRIPSLLLAILLVLSASACASNKSQLTDDVPTATTAPTPTPEPTPSYTFEDVVVNKPEYFKDGGDKFTVESEDTNYYGEISVGQRSYVEGTSPNNGIDGTYALFISENRSIPLTVTIHEEGYYGAFSDIGIAKGNEVEYPFNVQENIDGLLSTGKDFSTRVFIDALSYIRVHWSRSSFLPEWSFRMLAVVITKDEALQYALDGTLPKALQGLNVIGLDEILAKPADNASAGSKAAETLPIKMRSNPLSATQHAESI